jgi:hypothetical protein
MLFENQEPMSEPKRLSDILRYFEQDLFLGIFHCNLLCPPLCTESVVFDEPDLKVYYNLVLSLDDGRLAFEFVEIFQRRHMLGSCLDDREKAIVLFEILEEVNAGLGKKGGTGNLKILEVIAVPDHVHGIEIVKRDGKQHFTAFL